MFYYVEKLQVSMDLNFIHFVEAIRIIRYYYWKKNCHVAILKVNGYKGHQDRWVWRAVLKLLLDNADIDLCIRFMSSARAM